MKTVISLLLSVCMLFLSVPGVLWADHDEDTTETPNEDVQVYLQARELVTRQALYTHESMNPLLIALSGLDSKTAVAENLDKIREGKATTLAAVNQLRKAIDGLVRSDKPESVLIDIWEGKEPPAPNGIRDNADATAPGSLTDAAGYRPMMTDCRLKDPQKAKGTVILIPSIRGSYSEQLELAGIFNLLGFNAFCVEARMNTSEGLGYEALFLDAQRAIRYLRFHAEELQIDESRFVLLGGSKGNGSHVATFQYFDRTPAQRAAEKGYTLPGYEEDEVDRTYSTAAVCCVDYGAASLNGWQGSFSPEVITGSRIYSVENFRRGLKFPDLCFIGGTLDSDILDMPAIISGLYAYNHGSKLYPIHYEFHIMDDVAHGFGAGSQHANLTRQWLEIGAYLETVLK